MVAAATLSVDSGDHSAGRVLAIVPAHNEAAHVAAIVRGLLKQELPVLVIDDGSLDGTSEVAVLAGASVLRLDPNRGKGGALKAGFGYALEEGSATARWEAFLTVDGDGQHDVTAAPAFLQEWETTHPDLVIGARDYSGMPRVRSFTNSVSRLLFSWAVGQHVPDNQSGYRLHSRRMASAALDSEEEGFAFEVEEIAICLGRGYSLAWVPIPTIYNSESSDIRPWSHFAGFVRVIRRARRIKNLEKIRATRSGP